MVEDNTDSWMDITSTQQPEPTLRKNESEELHALELKSEQTFDPEESK